MQNTLVRVLLINLLVLATALPLQPASKMRFDRLQRELENLRITLRIPGMSAAIVQDQRIVWAAGMGFADLEQHRRADENTPYVIGSLTKPIAATVLLQLLQQNKLSLDDPMSKYYHEHFQTDHVKVRHILTHTAAYTQGTRPGDTYKYSGSFFGYVAKVIEVCSGNSFRKQLITHILEPLQMTDSVPGLDIMDLPADAADAPASDARARYTAALQRLAKPYALYGKDENVLSPYPPSWIGSSAGLISTVMDLAKFDIALDRHALISSEMQSLAWTPAVANDGHTLPYGLGWFVQYDHGVKLVWHYGQWPTFAGLILKVPEKQITLILLANSTALNSPFLLSETGDVLTSAFALAFLRMVVEEESVGKKLPSPDWAMAAGKFSDAVARFERMDGDHYRRVKEAHRAILAYLMSREAQRRP